MKNYKKRALEIEHENINNINIINDLSPDSLEKVIEIKNDGYSCTGLLGECYDDAALKVLTYNQNDDYYEIKDEVEILISLHYSKREIKSILTTEFDLNEEIIEKCLDEFFHKTGVNPLQRPYDVDDLYSFW